MEFHRGRLFDHVHLRVSDLTASKRFYRAVFTALGWPDIVQEGPDFFYADELPSSTPKCRFRIFGEAASM